MLTVNGHAKRLCNGLTRRDLIKVGGMGLAGATVPSLARPSGALAGNASRPGVGKAKNVICLFLYGSHSQLETFDPKPDAPEGIRGEMGVIPTNLPGVFVNELMPHTAKIMDRLTVIRSVTHQYPVHGVAYAMTGNPRVTLPMELNPHDPDHWPYLGSLVDYLDARENPGVIPPMPRNMGLPWAFSSQRVGEVARAGPYGGFLGSTYDPTWTEFVGEGTKKARKTLTDKVWNDYEFYRGVTPESRLRLPGMNEAAANEMALDRLDRRRSLLNQIEQVRRGESTDWLKGVDRERAQAYRLLDSPKFRQAFDIDQEPAAVRESYGMSLFGQSALTARRLIEAGGRFVSVFWDEFGLAGTGWDTHWDHFPRMKDELLPGLDMAFSGLIGDLDRRGMLDETLVLLMSEHGRTPKIATNVSGGGRDHWSRCYSLVMAGAGIKRGHIVGKSDRIAGDVVDNPVSPKDILATTLHLLGYDHTETIQDRQQRPMPLVAESRILTEVLS
jgi:hypothetical protein